MRYLLALLSFFFLACATPRPQTRVDRSDPAAAAKDLANDSVGDAESHRRTVVAHADEFGRCYRPALRANPKLQGEVTLTWEVDAAGIVTKEAVIESRTSIQNKLMIECMLERLHTWRFEAGPKDSVSTVTYPFYFNPGL